MADVGYPCGASGIGFSTVASSDGAPAFDAATAARAAVLAHARAGDAVASRLGERGILAGEVAAALRSFVNPEGGGA